MGLTVKRKEDILPRFVLYYFLFYVILSDIASNANPPSISASNLKDYKIPLPPKDIQRKIVTEIEEVESKENNFSNHIRDLYSSIFALLRSIKSVGKISDLCQIRNIKLNPQNFLNDNFINIGLENIESHTGNFIEKPNMSGNEILSIKNTIERDDILYGKLRPYLNKVAVANFTGICSTDILVLKTETPNILKYILLSPEILRQTSKLVSGLRMPRIKPVDLVKLNAPLPSPFERKKITTEIEKIEAQIKKNQRELDEIPKQKEAILKKYLQ